MPKNELPSWIHEMLQRQPYSCSEPGYVHLRQVWVRERVTAIVEAYEDGCEELRGACREHLHDEDATVVENALTCLFVVGLAEDADVVEPLLAHSDDSIRKAARTCLFEIRRR